MSCRSFACAFAACITLTFSTAAAADSPAAACLSAQWRQQELREFDEIQLTRARPATAPAPAELQEAFARLVRVARLPAGVQLRLVAVHDGLNAWVDRTGTVYVSAGLWTGDQRLGIDEVAAVLAHEIAHVEAVDALAKLCDTVALVGNEQHSFKSARLAIYRAIRAGDRTLAIRMMQQNHQRELRADRRGTQLLAAAGFQPEAMGRMLIKVTRGQGDYSASHPAVEHRLEALGFELR